VVPSFRDTILGLLSVFLAVTGLALALLELTWPFQTPYSFLRFQISSLAASALAVVTNPNMCVEAVIVLFRLKKTTDRSITQVASDIAKTLMLIRVAVFGMALLYIAMTWLVT
jgi:hypothetical protein